MAARRLLRRARPRTSTRSVGGLPETWFGTSWGDVPTWLVPAAGEGRQGPRVRALPQAAQDRGRPARPGEPYDDLLVIRTANPDDKQALVDGGRPVLHHRPLQGLQRRARAAVAARRDHPRRARRGDHGRVAGHGAQEAGQGVPRVSGASRDASRSTRPGWRRTTCCVAVREDDAYANLVLPQLLRERRIEGRDAAFVTELVGGTLRGQGCVRRRHRPPRRSAHPTRPSATRCGSAPTSCSAMRVPDHAAVDEHRRAGPRPGSATSRPGSPTR